VVRMDRAQTRLAKGPHPIIRRDGVRVESRWRGASPRGGRSRGGRLGCGSWLKCPNRVSVPGGKVATAPARPSYTSRPSGANVGFSLLVGTVVFAAAHGGGWLAVDAPRSNSTSRPGPAIGWARGGASVPHGLIRRLGGHAVFGIQLHPQGVGDPGDEVEEADDADRIDDRLVAPPRLAKPPDVRLPALPLLTRELPGEVEEREGPTIEGSAPVVALDRFGQNRIARLSAKPRCMGFDSVVAAVRHGDYGREHFPLCP
jgi:hypothetical protein